MKIKGAILFFIVSGCTPYVPPANRYITATEVSFTNEIKSNFKVQVLENNQWITLKDYGILSAGAHTDTINFTAGYYRVWCPLDSSQIINVK